MMFKTLGRLPALVPGTECSGLFVPEQLRFLGLVFFGRDGPGVPSPLQVNQLLADAGVPILRFALGAATE